LVSGDEFEVAMEQEGLLGNEGSDEK
jgi:hypothetical protein